MRDLILAFLVGFVVAWLGNGWRLDSEHSKIRANLIQSSNDALQMLRKQERAAHAKIEQIQADAEARQTELAATAAATAADNDRLRDTLTRLSKRYASDSATATSCKSAATAARVQAELLGGLSKLAEASARDSGAVRIALESCVAAFEAARGQIEQ